MRRRKKEGKNTVTGSLKERGGRHMGRPGRRPRPACPHGERKKGKIKYQKESKNQFVGAH